MFARDGDWQPLATGLTMPALRSTTRTPLYGSVSAGGAHGYGQVYALTGTTLKPIWNFTGGKDGASPIDNKVILGRAGALFVGAAWGQDINGCGTADMLTPPGPGRVAWSETTLHVFVGNPDGCQPNGLIAGANGKLYGTTRYGGTKGVGTVFEIVPPASDGATWMLRTLLSFAGGMDGSQPSQLTLGADDALYGTTTTGGGKSALKTCPNGCGTVFRLLPPSPGNSRWTEQILWRFTGGADGAAPAGAMLQDKDGALYATASAGGAANAGTAYKLSPPSSSQGDWAETTLYAFDGSVGAVPYSGLVADGAGVLYGATVYGGGTAGGTASGQGVLFSLTGTGFVPE